MGEKMHPKELNVQPRSYINGGLQGVGKTTSVAKLAKFL